jgi:hypothetical protein
VCVSQVKLAYIDRTSDNLEFLSEALLVEINLPSRDNQLTRMNDLYFESRFITKESIPIRYTHTRYYLLGSLTLGSHRVLFREPCQWCKLLVCSSFIR